MSTTVRWRRQGESQMQSPIAQEPQKTSPKKTVIDECKTYMPDRGSIYQSIGREDYSKIHRTG